MYRSTLNSELVAYGTFSLLMLPIIMLDVSDDLGSVLAMGGFLRLFSSFFLSSISRWIFKISICEFDYKKSYEQTTYHVSNFNFKLN